MSDARSPSVAELADDQAMSPETFVNPAVAQFLKNVVSSVATLPKRAFESSENLRLGGDYDPGPILEAATLPMGTGALAGLPMRAGEAALGSGAIRYKQALERGEITKSEYEGFMQALGENDAVVRAQPPGFPDKAAARVELNSSQRMLDKYWAKDQARREGGPALTASERSEWNDAFKRKQKAQQYLESTQPIVLTPVDHDPFAGSQ